jgi:hypothetical protein
MKRCLGGAVQSIIPKQIPFYSVSNLSFTNFVMRYVKLTKCIKNFHDKNKKRFTV